MVALIQNFRLTNEEQAPLIKAIDIDGQDIEEVVAGWLKANEAKWKAWLPES